MGVGAQGEAGSSRLAQAAEMSSLAAMAERAEEEEQPASASKSSPGKRSPLWAHANRRAPTSLVAKVLHNLQVSIHSYTCATRTRPTLPAARLQLA